MEEHEMKDPFTWLIVKSFWKTNILNGYFSLSPLDYLIEGYVNYIWCVEKLLALSHDLAIFNYIFSNLHNFKY